MEMESEPWSDEAARVQEFCERMPAAVRAPMIAPVIILAQLAGTLQAVRNLNKMLWLSMGERATGGEPVARGEGLGCGVKVSDIWRIYGFYRERAVSGGFHFYINGFNDSLCDIGGDFFVILGDGEI